MRNSARPVAPARWLRVLAASLLCLALAACKMGLYSNLNESEANEIVAALAAEGISAGKTRQEGNTWQVEVDESDMGAALGVLRAQGLPHERFVSMGEVFQKQGLVSTPSEERMRYIYATSQELSQTLRTIDGVVSARVHVVIPANDPLSERVRPSSAAVFIKYRPDVDLRLLTPAVKELVAHSIEGLTHDQVSLSLFETRRVPAGSSARAADDVPAPSTLLGGLLPSRSALVLLALGALAVACLLALPALLSRRGVDARTWASTYFARR